MFLLEKCVLRGPHPRHGGRPPLERRDRSARLGRAHTAQDWCSLLSTPRAVPKHHLGVRALCCALQVLHLSSCFVFWPRQLSFWRWRLLQAGDRGAASCAANAPTQPPSAAEGSLGCDPRCVLAARRVAEVSPRGSARCGCHAVGVAFRGPGGFWATRRWPKTPAGTWQLTRDLRAAPTPHPRWLGQPEGW
jgi:hypothetical protein